MRSKLLILVALATVLVVLCQGSAAAAFEEIYARVWVSSIEEKVRLLDERGLIIDAAGPNWVDVVIDSGQLGDLVAKGYDVEVVYGSPQERNVALFGVDWDRQFHSYADQVTEMLQAASG